MRTALRFLVLSLSSFLILPAVAGAAVPIAKVRDLPPGTTVTIEGRVTAGFSSFFADEVELQPRFPDDIRPAH